MGISISINPIAPPEIRVLVHMKPTEQTTWSPHGADGWYTGPALDLYSCYNVWMWTRMLRAFATRSLGSPPKSPYRLPPQTT
jgi:hypothetical protein